MTDVPLNSDAEMDALLAKLIALAAEAEELERRTRETYLRAREVILDMQRVGSKKRTSNRAIAKAIGKSPNWVDQLLKEEWVATDGGTPFSGGRNNAQGIRKAFADDPEMATEQIMDELIKHPNAVRRFKREFPKRLAAEKPPSAKEPPSPPKDHLFIPLRDHIVMNEHVLFVGSSTNAYFKHRVLDHIGVSHEGHPDQYPIESGLVVVTDPPYGQNEPGVPGDGSADHSSVYNMLKPRGGFSFCAYRPPLFRQAEEGIEKADGVPIHYLAMRTKSAMGQGPDGRLHNLLQSIIYWERRGAKPWIKGRTAVSVLEADELAREEMREVRKQHTTPKPVNVMEDLIDLVTEEGDFVLDPFAGSGSTLIACERTNRRFIGFEGNGITDADRKKWDPHPYAEVAVQRWEDMPGNKGKAVVYRANADPPTMLFEELVAKGRWHADSRWAEDGAHSLTGSINP